MEEITITTQGALILIVCMVFSSFETQLNDAADHLMGVLDSREKAVAGTTYKDLSQLISTISTCGYFDQPPEAEAEEEPEAVEIEPEETSEEGTRARGCLHAV